MSDRKLMPGAEPFLFPGGEIGCLLIHGYTGTPFEMRLMGEFLSGRGITASGVRLQGHGTSPEEMAACRYTDWLESAEAALLELHQHCTEVYLAGLSMGGAISLYLAHRHSQKVKGIIPICAPVFLKDWRLALLPAARCLVKTLPKLGKASAQTKDPTVEVVTYPKIPVPSILELVRLLQTVKAILPEIKQPALVIGARDDQTVSQENIEYIYQNIGSEEKKLLWLENSYHLATLDYDKDIVFEQTLQFIQNSS